MKLEYFLRSEARHSECGMKTGSGRWLTAQLHLMEPPQIAVQVLGGKAAEAMQEVLDPAVTAVARLDMQRASHPLSG